MTPPPSSHSSSATYHRIPWSWIFQWGGLVLALIALFAASTKYPIVNWIGDAREDVQQLGFWSGIVYPIAYALCNLLLLPGGILSMGGGFFFGLWWGFFLILAGNLLGAAFAFVIARKVGRQRIDRATFQQPQTSNPGWCDRTARLEDRGAVATEPVGSIEPTELSLRPDASASQPLLTLGGAWTGSGIISVRVHRYSWSIRRRYGPRDPKTRFA